MLLALLALAVETRAALDRAVLEDDPWVRLKNRVLRLHAELALLAHGLIASSSERVDALLLPLDALLREVQALAAKYDGSTANVARRLYAAAGDEQKAQQLHARIDALMTDVAVQLNVNGEDGSPSPLRHAARADGECSPTAPSPSHPPSAAAAASPRGRDSSGRSQERQDELKVLLELMSKLVLERVDETERKTLAQLESLRRIALSQQGRSEEKERLEDERALKKPLAERLPGLPIIPHTELEFAEAHASFNLGKGGFGCVVKGKWLRQGRLPVAVKLPYKLDVDPIERARFEEEVALLYKLRGELNVVSMLAVCLEAGHEAIVMRLMQGGNLFHRLQQARKDPATRGLSWEKKLDIAMDIVRGVNALHMLPPPLGPVLHRDLKSLNVLLDEHDCACLTDFGLSRVEHRPEDGEFHTFAPDKLAGTAHWRAPEQQVLGQKARYNARCDVFSIGVVLWELATEQAPWAHIRHQHEVGELILRGFRPPIPDTVPDYFRCWIAACWAQDADQRPLCGPLLDDMQAVQEMLRKERTTGTRRTRVPAFDAGSQLHPFHPYGELLAGRPAQSQQLPAQRAIPPTAALLAGGGLAEEKTAAKRRPAPARPAAASPPLPPTPTAQPPVPARMAGGLARLSVDSERILRPGSGVGLPSTRSVVPQPRPDGVSAHSAPPLPKRALVDSGLKFRGLFHEGSGKPPVQVRVRLVFVHDAATLNGLMGSGVLAPARPFQLLGRWEMKEDERARGMWKLKIKAKLALSAEVHRRVEASCRRPDCVERFDFVGKWKDETASAASLQSQLLTSTSPTSGMQWELKEVDEADAHFDDHF